jgi:hypothetical protein
VLPAEAFVGLITYGRTVELRELDPKNLGRSYVFSVSSFRVFDRVFDRGFIQIS